METKPEINKLAEALNPLPQSLPIIGLLAQKERNRKRTSFPSLIRFAKLQQVKVTKAELENFFLQFQNAGIGKIEYVRNKAKYFVWNYSRQSVIEAVSGAGKPQLKLQKASRVKLPSLVKTAPITRSKPAGDMVGIINKKVNTSVIKQGETITVRRGDLELIIPLDMNIDQAKVIQMLLFARTA